MTNPRNPLDKSGTARKYKFGEFTFSSAVMLLEKDGAPVELDAIPLAALNLLLENAGQTVSKDEFLEEVWTGRFVEDGSLTVAISKLRKALAPRGAELIRTVHKVGYQFMGKVEFDTVTKPALRETLQPGQHAPHTRGWTLDRRIGRGGYGEAWLAHDASERQRVFKYASSASALRALKRELASYRVIESINPGAPGLLPILDTQFEKSPFYISSPYKGRSLDAWSNATRHQRIQVVAKVARILSLAHSVGVLHLDVKPKNILVEHADASAEPLVHLIDFGSAKLTNPQSAIGLGLTLGQTIAPHHSDVGSTPVFLAPEVIAGEVATTQSDVYSLGVVLYQTWLGDYKKPLATGWEADVEDPVVRGDIAAATSGDPRKRLTNAEDLAQRLEHIEQRRAELQENELRQKEEQRLRRELERSQARKPWAIALSAAMTIGLAITIGLYQQSESHRKKSEANLQISKALNNFLVEDLFSQADPNVGGDATISLRDALDKATEELPTRFASAPELLASIHATLGQLYYRTTNYSDAANFYRKALATSGSGTPTPQLRIDYARALMLAGNLDAATVELDSAQALAVPGSPMELKANVVRCRLLLLRTDWDALFPLITEVEAAIAGSLDIDSYTVNSFYGAALDGFMAVEKLDSAKAFAKHWLRYLNIAGSFEGSYIQAVVHQFLGRLHLTSGDVQEALRFAQIAESGLSQYVEKSDTVRLTNIQTMAVANSFLGRNDAAITAMRGVTEGQVQRLGADHPYTLIAFSDLGGMLTKGGYVEEAVQVLSAAHKQAHDSHGPRHFSSLMTGYNLTEALGYADEHEKAAALLEDISSAGEEAFPPEHQWGARVTFLTAKLASLREDWITAETFARRAIPMLESAAGVDEETKAEAAALLASIRSQRDNSL